MQQLGLIGYPLGHSFSKKYFTERFARQGITDWQYELYPLPTLEALPKLLRETEGLVGLNVTIPHKQGVLDFCTELHEGAKRIGAVNTLKRLPNGGWRGYNTDYIGFRESLGGWMGAAVDGVRALILGTGGAAKAVQVALEDLQVPYHYVSRSARPGVFAYTDLTPELLQEYRLIINTTPLGMAPNTETAPELPYAALRASHWLYDLVYNPETTEFMQRGLAAGAQVKNGLEMLIAQAEAAWAIWQEKE